MANVTDFLVWDQGLLRERAIWPQWGHLGDKLEQEDSHIGKTKIMIKGKLLMRKPALSHKPKLWGGNTWVMGQQLRD